MRNRPSLRGNDNCVVRPVNEFGLSSLECESPLSSCVFTEEKDAIRQQATETATGGRTGVTRPDSEMSSVVWVTCGLRECSECVGCNDDVVCDVGMVRRPDDFDKTGDRVAKFGGARIRIGAGKGRMDQLSSFTYESQYQDQGSGDDDNVRKGCQVVNNEGAVMR